MTSAPFPTPPPDDQPAPAPPQLRRSATDRMLGGVCGGLAEYSRIDIVLWRVGFVIAALFGGAGVVIYAVLWVIMPPPADVTDDRFGPLDRTATDLHRRLTGNRSRPAA